MSSDISENVVRSGFSIVPSKKKGEPSLVRWKDPETGTHRSIRYISERDLRFFQKLNSSEWERVSAGVGKVFLHRGDLQEIKGEEKWVKEFFSHFFAKAKKMSFSSGGLEKLFPEHIASKITEISKRKLPELIAAAQVSLDKRSTLKDSSFGDVCKLQCRIHDGNVELYAIEKKKGESGTYKTGAKIVRYGAFDKLALSNAVMIHLKLHNMKDIGDEERTFRLEDLDKEIIVTKELESKGVTNIAKYHGITTKNGNQIGVINEFLTLGGLDWMGYHSPTKGREREDFIRIIRDIAVGLEQIHGCGRIHGDVKPANMGATTDREARLSGKLIDLGGSVKVGNRIRQYSGLYAAPELLYGKSTKSIASCAADMHAFGVSLFEMYHGTENNPFRRIGASRSMKEYGVQYKEAREDAKKKLDLKDPIDAIINDLLLPPASYKQRPTASQVAERLSSLVSKYEFKQKLNFFEKRAETKRILGEEKRLAQWCQRGRKAQKRVHTNG